LAGFIPKMRISKTRLMKCAAPTISGGFFCICLSRWINRVFW
jgi:hypothetical protein